MSALQRAVKIGHQRSNAVNSLVTWFISH